MSKPKILFLDIETRPALAYVWRLHDENVGLEQMLEPSNILSVGWKFGGDAGVQYADVWPVRSGPARRKMLRAVHAALSAADAVVTYNGASFDLPKLNGEFLVSGMKPVPPIASIDVYKTVRKMGLTSGKLAHVAPLLGCGNKVATGGFSLWREYMAGDRKARASMRKYNEQDVLVLEKVYNRMLPFMTNHPYLGEFSGNCPNCGSKDVQHRGYRRTRAFKIERVHCQSCGTWSSGKRSKV